MSKLKSKEKTHFKTLKEGGEFGKSPEQKEVGFSGCLYVTARGKGMVKDQAEVDDQFQKRRTSDFLSFS